MSGSRMIRAAVSSIVDLVCVSEVRGPGAAMRRGYPTSLAPQSLPARSRRLHSTPVALLSLLSKTARIKEPRAAFTQGRRTGLPGLRRHLKTTQVLFPKPSAGYELALENFHVPVPVPRSR